MTAVAERLLLIAVLAHLAPEHIAEALGHKVVAWETVCYGAEAAALWAIALRFGGPVAVVATWGIVESLLRSGCRLLHPMSEPLRLSPGQFACDAGGFPVAWLSVIAALCVLFVLLTRP